MNVAPYSRALVSLTLSCYSRVRSRAAVPRSTTRRWSGSPLTTDVDDDGGSGPMASCQQAVFVAWLQQKDETRSLEVGVVTLIAV